MRELRNEPFSIINVAIVVVIVLLLGDAHAQESPLPFGTTINTETEAKRLHAFCMQSGGCTVFSKQDTLSMHATLTTLKSQVQGLEKRIAYCEERNFHSIRIVPTRLYVNDGVRGPNDFGGAR